MRRQTIFSIAVLVIAFDAGPITQGRTDARSPARASSDAAASIAGDRVILTLNDSTPVSSSLAAADEAALFGLVVAGDTLVSTQAVAAEPETDRAVDGATAPVPTAPSSEASDAAFTAPDMAGFAPHDAFSPVHEFDEHRQDDRASLRIGPLSAPSHRDGDLREPLRFGDEIEGSDVWGATVGVSFKLN